jgi:multidrug efflux pump subunit AcrA (membrane-fusion protein)
MKAKAVIITIAVLVVAGLVFIPSLVSGQSANGAAGGPGGGKRDGAGAAAAAVFSVRAEDAEIRNLQAYIEVNGNIVSEQQVAVSPEAAGKLVSMKADLGSTVRKGDLLAEVDPSRPGAEYSLSPVYAPVSGVVASSPVPVGSTVSTNTALLTIAAAGSLEIEALIPEREVGQLRAGLSAEVRLEAFPGEVFAAELVRLSPLIDPASRTKKVALRFTHNDSRVNPGMFARIKLSTRRYENVVSIPQEAVTDKRGSAVVYVVNPGAVGGSAPSVNMREVSIGVSIDGEVEIKSGLAAGESVVVQGQQFLTDGAAVRVIGKI